MTVANEYESTTIGASTVFTRFIGARLLEPIPPRRYFPASGAFWTLQADKVILALRCCHLNHGFEEDAHSPLSFGEGKRWSARNRSAVPSAVPDFEDARKARRDFIQDDVTGKDAKLTPFRLRLEAQALPEELRPPASTFRESPSASRQGMLRSLLPGPWAEETGKVIPVWHTPMHWRYIEDTSLDPLPAKSEPTADAWESYLFEQNGLNWKDHLPPTFVPNVHPSLRPWVKSQARHAFDPNYSFDERMAAPHTNGVIPSANTSAAVRWMLAPVVPEEPPRLDFGKTRSVEVVQRIEANRQALQDIRDAYEQDPRTHSGTPTPEEVSQWEKALKDEARLQWIDEVRAAEQTWEAAHAEVTARYKSVLENDRKLYELWKSILETDKKLYHPTRPRAARELVPVRVIVLHKWSHFTNEDAESIHVDNDDFNYRAQAVSESDWRVNGDGDDEESDPGFEADNISYAGVRETYDHPDLPEHNRALQYKYDKLIQQTKFKTHDERLEELRKQRDSESDALKLLVLTRNAKLSNMRPGGEKVKSNTLVQNIRRADVRTEQALHDAQAEADGVDPLFTRAVNQMAREEVYTTVCQGGVFVIVVLNYQPELKYLAPLDATKDECETAFMKLQRESVRNAVKHAQKVARSAGLGKRATAKSVSEARERIERAYDDVETFYHQAPCPVHFLEPKVSVSTS